MKEDDPIENDNTDRNDCTSKKRCSVSLNRNDADEQQEEELQQSIVASLSKNKRMRTYHVRTTSKFAVNVPIQAGTCAIYIQPHTTIIKVRYF